MIKVSRLRSQFSRVTPAVLSSTIGFVLVASGGCAVESGEEPAPEQQESDEFGDKYANVDPSTLTQDEKFVLVIEWMGFDPEGAVVLPEGWVVDGDVLIRGSELDGYVERIFNPEKAYICRFESGSTSAGSANGKPCKMTANDVAESVNSIRLDIDAGLSAGWKLAFRRAAAAWSGVRHEGTQVEVSIDAEGKRSNSSRWTIVIDPTNGGANGFVALASPPTFVPLGGGWQAMSPGTLVLANMDGAYTQAKMDHTALHELGHTLGYHHPSISNVQLAGTAAAGNSIWCEDYSTGGNYKTAMCSGDGYGSYFLSDDDRLAASMLYPREDIFDLTSWDWGFCSVDNPCDIGEGDCDNNNQCKGFLICNGTSAAVSRYGAPYESGGSSSGDVCTPPNSVRNEGATSCNSGFSINRCSSVDCPCGAGLGDCEPGECGGGLECGVDNGPAFGQSSSWDLCVHPRPPGCPAMNRENIPTSDDEVCTPDCPCSFGEGDCDTDADCIGDLVCALNVGSSFLRMPSTFDVCVDPSAVANL